MKNKTALIMVDLQNDFCENGNLPVLKASEIIPLANQLQKQFDLVIATKDWHPKDHISFASNHPNKKIGQIIKVNQLEQILWPVHCVQESKGSDFHPMLETHSIDHIIYKGTDKNIDSYSAFFDNAGLKKTGLADYLNEIKEIYILGLATEYCVKYSCLDAVKLGFTTYFIQDASRGVELSKGDKEKAINEMKTAGVNVIRSVDIIRHYSMNSL